jgi:amidase
MSFRFHIPQYLSRRAADWPAHGSTETLVDFPSLNARSKFWGDDGRAAFRNWEEVADPRNPLGGRQGVDERIMLPGREDILLKIASAYEAASKRRIPPPAFGPLPAKASEAHPHR